MFNDALQKAISVAEKNPKGLMGLRWYLLICHELDITARPEGQSVIFSTQGQEAKTNLITDKNATKFKCQVKPGTESILIYEFMQVLVTLLTDKSIPEKEFDKLGPRAEYYVTESCNILKEYIATAAT